MKEFFESRRFKGMISLTLSNKEKWFKDKAELCKEIIEVVERYSRAGYILTLRQLYYQLVSMNLIRNDDVVYKKLSSILDDLRQAGIIDWDAIEDRGRRPQLAYYVLGVSDALNDTIKHYRRDRQSGQNNHIEVWTEKDAISGILSRVTNKYHVRLVVNKGYSSNSAMYGAYKRFADSLKDGKDVCILYFGDHDPSGLDMIRDIRERILHFLASSENANDILPEPSNPGYGFIEEYLAENDLDYVSLYEEGFLDEKCFTFFEYNVSEHDRYADFIDELLKAARKHYWSTRFKVVPIGLTVEQINKYNPPQNPAKLTDPRAEWYIKKFGQKSWEVDALPPNVMTQVVDDAIKNRIDYKQYENMLSIERTDIETLKGFISAINKGNDFEDDPDEQ